jgi:hypothetical protein
MVTIIFARNLWEPKVEPGLGEDDEKTTAASGRGPGMEQRAC